MLKIVTCFLICIVSANAQGACLQQCFDNILKEINGTVVTMNNEVKGKLSPKFFKVFMTSFDYAFKQAIQKADKAVKGGSVQEFVDLCMINPFSFETTLIQEFEKGQDGSPDFEKSLAVVAEELIKFLSVFEAETKKAAKEAESKCK